MAEQQLTHGVPRWLLVTGVIIAALALLGISFAVGRATGSPPASTKPATVAPFSPTSHLKLQTPHRPTGTVGGGVSTSANNAGDQLQSELSVSRLEGADDVCGQLLFLAPVTFKDLTSDDPLEGLPAFQLTAADATRGNYGGVARQFPTSKAAATFLVNDISLLGNCSTIGDDNQDVSPTLTKTVVRGAGVIAWSYEKGENEPGTTTVRVADLQVANRVIRATCTMTPSDQRALVACSSWLKRLVAIEREN